MKSTMFKGSMKNFSLFGQIMKRTIISNVNIAQTTYSMIKTLSVVKVEFVVENVIAI